jgi:hypothetical protein
MTNAINHEAEYARIAKAVEASYPDLYLVDVSCDSENVAGIDGKMIPMPECRWGEGHAAFWEAMVNCLHYSVGMRMEENGLSNADMVAVGIRY